MHTHRETGMKMNSRGRVSRGTAHRSTALMLIAALGLLLMPQAGGASAACGVLSDPVGDVSGPLGTARPTATAGRTIDMTDVTIASTADQMIVTIHVADLGASPTIGTTGAFYGVFFSSGANRFFAQASRIAGAWSFNAGPAVGEALPQQGQPADGIALPSQDAVRIAVPRESVGSPDPGSMLQQIRAASQESASRAVQNNSGIEIREIAATSDRAGGADGGRLLVDGGCLPGISALGERCLMTGDAATDATSGVVPDATSQTPVVDALTGTPAENATRGAAFASVDPATEIVSVQTGFNPGTFIVEIGVAHLAQTIPAGADAERWDLRWIAGDTAYSAFAERRSSGPVFGFVTAGRSVPTTGSIDADSASIRILVPRHEIGADNEERLTNVQAISSIVVGSLRDPRDVAPNKDSFASQFIVGVSCADQQRAACPVVLDPIGDAGSFVDASGRTVPEYQPASDVTAAGVAAPDDSVVLSIRVQDIGAPPPDGFDMQGWTISWAFAGTRYIAQAERGRQSTVFRTAALGSAADYPGPSTAAFPATSKAADGTFDIQSGVIRIVAPRSDVGSPVNGDRLDEVGVRSWVMTARQVAGSANAPVRQYPNVDETQLAPYLVGIACSA